MNISAYEAIIFKTEEYEDLNLLQEVYKLKKLHRSVKKNYPQLRKKTKNVARC